MRLIKKVSEVVAVYFDSEWAEYVARVTGQPDSDYHTDDKQDAIDTAVAMASSNAPRTRATAMYQAHLENDTLDLY